MKQALQLGACATGLLAVIGYNVHYAMKTPDSKSGANAYNAASMGFAPQGSDGGDMTSDDGGEVSDSWLFGDKPPQSKDPRSRQRQPAKRSQEPAVTPANAEKPGLAAAMGLGVLISSSRQEWQAAEKPEQVAEGRDSKASPKAAPSVKENEPEPDTAVAQKPDTAVAQKPDTAVAQKPDTAEAKSAVADEVVAADTAEQAAPASKLDVFGGKLEASSGEFALVRTPLMYDWEAQYGNADLQSELEGQADSPIADRVDFTGLAMTEARGALRAVALINGSFFRQGDEIEMGLILQRIDPRGGKIQVSDGKELAVISLPSLFVGDTGGGQGGVNVRQGSDNDLGQGSGGGRGGQRSSSRGGEGRGGEGRGGSQRSSSRGGEGGGSRRGSMGESSRGGRGGSSRGEGGSSRGRRGGSNSIPGPGQRSGGGRSGGREGSGGGR